MSILNYDSWEQVELSSYGKGKLIHIVNQQAARVAELQEYLDQTAHSLLEAEGKVCDLEQENRTLHDIAGNYLVQVAIARKDTVKEIFQYITSLRDKNINQYVLLAELKAKFGLEVSNG